MPGIPRRASHLSFWLWAMAGIAVSACATGGGAPPATTPPPEAAPSDERRPAETGAAPDSSAADPTAVFLARFAPPEPEASLPPVLPFGLLWTPSEPTEGSAVGIRVLQPVAGREPVSVEGTLAGRPVRFGTVDGSWFGIAAVPIGSGEEAELSLRFVFDDGSRREQRVALSIHHRQWARTKLRVAPRFSSPPPEVLDRIRREREQFRTVLDSATSGWLLDGPFEPPRPLQVTSPFGQERMFNGELQSRHTGVDLKGAEGEPARAAARGRVALTGEFYYSGKGVVLDHGLGVYTGYFHLSRIRVREGQLVQQGEIVGDVGATGRVTGPHLHWSAWVAGESLDAASLLEIPVP